MKRVIAYYGILCGVILTLYVRLLDLSKLIYTTTWGKYLGYLAILILPICIYLTIIQIRRHSQKLLFRHSVFAGLLIALLTATTYCAYMFVDIRFFNARHLKNVFQFTRDEMTKAGYRVSEINARITEMKLHYFSAQPYFNTYWMYLAMGLFYGIIFYFIFRFKPLSKKSI